MDRDGSRGVAPLCAPSAMKHVYYGDAGLMPMRAAESAVVATDYHGWGTEGPHQYVNKVGQACDVINLISAAPAAVSSLGRDRSSAQPEGLRLPRRRFRGRGGTGGGLFFGHWSNTPGVGFYAGLHGRLNRRAVSAVQSA